MEVVNKLFKTLLNRKSTIEEINKLYKLDINKIKYYIKNTDEFKNFRLKNLKTITNIFYKIFDENIKPENIKPENIKPENIKPEKFLRKFILLEYNEDNMFNYCLKIVENINYEYTSIYKNYIDINETIEPYEILEVINNSLQLDKYILISHKFISKSEEKLNNILNL